MDLLAAAPAVISLLSRAVLDEPRGPLEPVRTALSLALMARGGSERADPREDVDAPPLEATALDKSLLSFSDVFKGWSADGVHGFLQARARGQDEVTLQDLLDMSIAKPRHHGAATPAALRETRAVLFFLLSGGDVATERVRCDAVMETLFAQPPRVPPRPLGVAELAWAVRRCL